MTRTVLRDFRVVAVKYASGRGKWIVDGRGRVVVIFIPTPANFRRHVDSLTTSTTQNINL